MLRRVEGMLAPIANTAVGLVITVFMFTREEAAVDRVMVGFWLGPMVTTFSAMALMVKGARFGATLAGAALVLLGVGAPHRWGGHAAIFEIAMGMVAVALSLPPNREVRAHPRGPPTSGAPSH